jgi:hypothetical protein
MLIGLLDFGVTRIDLSFDLDVSHSKLITIDGCRKALWLGSFKTFELAAVLGHNTAIGLPNQHAYDKAISQVKHSNSGMV